MRRPFIIENPSRPALDVAAHGRIRRVVHLVDAAKLVILLEWQRSREGRQPRTSQIAVGAIPAGRFRGIERFQRCTTRGPRVSGGKECSRGMHLRASHPDLQSALGRQRGGVLG